MGLCMSVKEHIGMIPIFHLNAASKDPIFKNMLTTLAFEPIKQRMQRQCLVSPKLWKNQNQIPLQDNNIQLYYYPRGR